MDRFVDLAQRVRTHICYAHVFGDALTEEQLVERCAPAAPGAVRMELARLDDEGAVERVEGLWFLSGEAVEGLGAIKRCGEVAAEAILRDHGALLALVRRLPFVRMLAVSGSVAWRNHGRRNGKALDLDLFLITAPRGVHVVRLLLRAWGLGEAWASRLGWRRPRAPICANYITDGDVLDVTNKSFYTASDALNVRVLKGPNEYRRFVEANAWMGRYYPIGAPGGRTTRAPSRSLPLAVVNTACFMVLAACSWLKLLLTNWRRGERQPFAYSLRFRYDTETSLVRSAPAGGGRQPQVACRFEKVYTRHFGRDEGLLSFLFPGTTKEGVYTSDGHVRSRIVAPLGYHE